MTIQFKSSVPLESRISADPIYGAISTPKYVQNGFYRSGGKLLLDYTLVLLSLPIVLPVIAFCALMVAMSGGQPFYWQERLGKSGRVFHILKLRTMVQNADEVLANHLKANPDARYEWDHKQKLCDDPRVTPVGRFLRKTSLDELPQLWNVLKGDMSLIGPRPMMVDQQELYSGSAYYRMRPGITGSWQVSDRNESAFTDRAFFDTDYYYTLSLKTDCNIFLRTFGAVLRGTGY